MRCASWGRAPGLYVYENILREAMIEALLAKSAQAQ